MREIELSTMVPVGGLDLAGLSERGFLRVRHQQFNWDTGWNNVLQVGLYQKGPDVSEVGSTWLQNLFDMHALRPLHQSELNSLGGEDAFMPNSWRRESEAGTLPRLSSVPWTMDTRLFHYRRDLLAQAGIDEAGAFATPEAVYDTLCRLQAAGMRYPLSLATGGLTMHNLACFIWGRGGGFRSEDYHRITLIEPEARRGLLDFFRLHTFIDPQTRGSDYAASDRRYMFGQAAVVLTGNWAMKMIKDHWDQIPDVVIENSGYAAPPGIPYVGSTHLVIWRHSIHEMDALQLIGHLTSPAVLQQVFNRTGVFPARIASLDAPPFSGDPDYELVVDCLRRGRNFRAAHLWAGVEMRLNAMCDQLWADLLANPEMDLEAEIERRVRELATRLERTILASW